MAALNAEQVRALLFQRKLKVVPLAASLPDLPDLDGLLAIRELTGTDTSDIDGLSKTANGTTDNALAVAALVIRGLVLLETKERIFADTEITSVSEMGFTVLMPISNAVGELSGLSPEALANAKKNLTNPPANTSPTSSPANSEVVPAPN